MDAAITLFSRRGYAATSIADIHRQCGLAPDSRALYAHFSSKRELLEAATHRYTDRLVEDRKRFRMAQAESTDELLRRAAMMIWNGIDDNTRLLRVIFREAPFPELADELWSAITENVYGPFSDGLRAAVEGGVMHIADPEAAAAVLLAPLAYYPMVGMLIGHTPGGAVDRDRYLEAWLAHARAFLRQSASRPTQANGRSW